MTEGRPGEILRVASRRDALWTIAGGATLGSPAIAQSVQGHPVPDQPPLPIASEAITPFKVAVPQGD